LFSTDGTAPAAAASPENAPTHTSPSAHTGLAASSPGTRGSAPPPSSNSFQLSLENRLQEVRDLADDVRIGLADEDIGITDDNIAEFRRLHAELEKLAEKLMDAKLQPPAPAAEPDDAPIYGVRTRHGWM
jgi:hypothetical protein